MPLSQSIPQNGTVRFMIPVTYTNGFTGTVSFSTSTPPTGVEVSFPQTSITGSGQVFMDVKATTAIAIGTQFQIVVKGQSGSPSNLLVQKTLFTGIAKPEPAKVVSPVPNTKLPVTTPTFLVTTKPGIGEIRVRIGTTPGGSSLFNQTTLALPGQSLAGWVDCATGPSSCLPYSPTSLPTNVAVYVTVTSTLADGTKLADEQSVYNVSTKEYIYLNNRLIAIEVQ